MGISGLLPALKSIQVTRHLSEYSGKTVAVDAYVWLHRGVYSCAIELATGKATNKYVDYAMHRVRMLQHYKIIPYIVFDGGPLPAKKGTESERKARREENLAKGKAFMAQGKMSQAREFFIKCADVTPEMAFQFIKALRAESVSYVVAPYEADAQLAYLELAGFVDAILTEDSDLLVFGCQNVLFKFDSVNATVVSISRKDFGAVATSPGDANSISLIGWSDVQFRAMAILSGCDYLPSIPGIGLKTACNLLKKWKTPDAVIRAISIEGKKSVPPGYSKQFKLAEKCFLHQRVYCPRQEKLVHLTDVDSDWNEEFDAYVGSDIEPTLAKGIALGNYDPDSYLPIKDINPDFLPRALKPIHMETNTPSMTSKGKSKARQSLPTPVKSGGGILDFFGRNPIIPAAPPKKKPVAIPMKHQTVSVGKASGKRTLSEVMDQDLAHKKRHRHSYSPIKSAQSRFFSANDETKFGSVRRRHSDGLPPVAGPSRTHANKENFHVATDAEDQKLEDSESDMNVSDLSLQGRIDEINSDGRVSLNIEEFSDVVEQEDGYLSPSSSCSKDAQDLSSPPGPSRQRRVVSLTGVIPSDDEEEADTSFGAEVVSSPVSVRKPKSRSRFHNEKTPLRRIAKSKSKAAGESQVVVLVASTPSPEGKERLYPDIDDVPSPTLYCGPDLRKMLGDEETVLDFNEKVKSVSGSASPPSPSSETPNCNEQQPARFIDVVDVDALEDEDDPRWQQELVAQSQAAVMAGWKQRWALPPAKTPLQARRSVQHVITQRHPIRPLSPKMTSKKLKTSPPGSSRPTTSRAFELRRSDTNVTPAGRHSLANYKPPRSAPSKLFGTSGNSNSSMNPPNIKQLDKGQPRRNVLLFETVKVSGKGNGSASSASSQNHSEPIDLTMDDEIEELDPTAWTDEMVTTSARARLSHFRCALNFFFTSFWLC
ncbi:Exodeoxyribonuclease 1 [Psilocybe cubensis]|uniref:Exonuclease 1 n=2 Tax=Psilocybe cubensis TaxID=181762 RepID=A0A8H7XWL7_PSICU|nr:Exodeoxyribonuclease 1 [Psilocybe cubensis]KAH9478566.1 Exodeoxyribonuclease 1 [Psilocybe cubensis]